MEVEKEAVFRRIEGDEAISHKKLLLETEISTIQLMKFVERFRLIRQIDEEQTANAKKAMLSVRDAVARLIEALPKSEKILGEEGKLMKKMEKKKKTNISKLGDLDVELKMIQEKLDSLH